MDNIEIDMGKTKKFYKNYKDFCNCLYCKFYRENIKKYYTKLSDFLSEFAIDVSKPYELSIPFLDEDLIYPFAQYLAIGKVSDKFSKNIGNLSFSIAKSYPDVDISSPYFVLEVGDIEFKESIISEEMLSDLSL